jgi:hypothetical protein
VVANTIMIRHTVYIGLALDALAAVGDAGADWELAWHLSPALLEPIRVSGTSTLDVSAEWRRPGYRPLREPARRKPERPRWGT